MLAVVYRDKLAHDSESHSGGWLRSPVRCSVPLACVPRVAAGEVAMEVSTPGSKPAHPDPDNRQPWACVIWPWRTSVSHLGVAEQEGNRNAGSWNPDCWRNRGDVPQMRRANSVSWLQAWSRRSRMSGAGLSCRSNCCLRGWSGRPRKLSLLLGGDTGSSERSKSCNQDQGILGGLGSSSSCSMSWGRCERL